MDASRRFTPDSDVYRKLFESDRVPQLLIDPDTSDILHANAAAASFYGYSAEELARMKVSAINVLSAADIAAEMQKAKKEQRNFFHFRHRLKDGSVVPVEVISYPIALSDRTILFSTVYPSDIQNRLRFLLTDVFYRSADAIVIIDPDGRVIAVNDSFTRMFGFSAADVVGAQLEDFVLSPQENIDVALRYRAAYEGKVVNAEAKRRTRDGRMIDVAITAIPYHHGNEPLGLRIVYRDIADKIRREEELRLFREIIQNDTDGVLVADREGVVGFVNRAFLASTGHAESEVVGAPAARFAADPGKPPFTEAAWRAIGQAGEWQGETWSRRADNEAFPQWLHVFAIHDAASAIVNYVLIFKDLSRIDSVNTKLLLFVEKDPLTAVHNRVYFMDRLRREIASGVGEGHLVFIDLDGFKALNDAYGHHVGDLVLTAFARQLTETFESAVVARYGGDEFVVWCDDSGCRAELERRIDRLAVRLAGGIDADGIRLRLSFSAGLASYPADAADPELLLIRADKAMYRAKELKAGRFAWSDMGRR